MLKTSGWELNTRNNNYSSEICSYVLHYLVTYGNCLISLLSYISLWITAYSPIDRHCRIIAGRVLDHHWIISTHAISVVVMLLSAFAPLMYKSQNVEIGVGGVSRPCVFCSRLPAFVCTSIPNKNQALIPPPPYVCILSFSFLSPSHSYLILENLEYLNIMNNFRKIL